MAPFRCGHGDTAGDRSGDPGSELDVPGLDEYALSHGWRLLGDTPVTDLITVTDGVLRSWTGQTAGSAGTIGVGTTEFRNAYIGAIAGPFDTETAAHGFRAANGWTGFAGMRRRGVSVCALQLAVLLPMTSIELRPHYSIAHHLPEVTTGDAGFNARFGVRSQDPQRARDLLNPSIRALAMSRDDWAFTLAGNHIYAVCATTYQAGEDISHRIAELQAFAAAIPLSALPQPGRQLRTLPDGTVLDDRDPERVQASLAAMTPEQRADLTADFERRRAGRRQHRSQ
jgi:hypothetical protein